MGRLLRMRGEWAPQQTLEVRECPRRYLRWKKQCDKPCRAAARAPRAARRAPCCKARTWIAAFRFRLPLTVPT